MTPAPPPPTDENVNDLLNEPAADNEGLDPETVDADFEQELEDLFADGLAEENLDEDGPVVLDDVVEEEPVAVAADDGDDELLILDDIAEEEDDLIVLDDVVLEEEEAPAEEELLLEEAAELPEETEDMEALVADIAEDDEVEEPKVEDDAIELDDLVEEAAADEEEVMELDALLEEADDETEEEISPEPEDLMDAALAEEAAPDVPVEEAVAVDELDAIMDEPEAEAAPEPEIEPESVPETQVVEGNVFANAAKPAAEPEDAELTGLEALDEDDIDDVDSLLDNVEVDVSDVVDAEAAMDDDLELDDLDIEGDLEEVLTAEAMPPDAGMEMGGMDVDELLVETRAEAGEASLGDLQSKVRMLEGRVEELEKKLKDEIAQLVPAEAARIIREEIAALAAELDD